MSKTIDQRVVEMRFDNQHFEKNVATSMSTLERLKKSLNLSGASKGLENISAAAKNNNLGLLGSAAEQVGVRFSAMQVAGMTAISRLTDHVLNSAERMVKALTIDPVTTGFNEYELKMNSVQTIMASTGESLETVNSYLEELNKYADQTIYSFQDMTSNIGKFTNAGINLEDAVAAIKGISNEAALSGANANEASRAMYNFSQALSAGYVKLIDWKSIENANMATKSFKEELIKTALEMGTLTDAGDGMYETLEGKLMNATKNFNDTLQDEWMTSEVLIKTLKKYASEKEEIGKKASEAATQVKTFTQMLDTLKEAAQSGWAKTWEIIFGDFYEARSLWTSVSKVVGGFIDKMSDARNAMLESALGSPWSKIEEEVSKAGISMDKFRDSLMQTAKKHGLVTDEMIKSETGFNDALAQGKITKKVVLETLKEFVGGTEKLGESTEDMTAKLKKFQDVVDQVWRGDFKNGVERIEELTKAGYDYAEVQDLVNKTVDGHRLTLDDLTDAQAKNLGFTDEQITALHELKKQAEDSGTTLGQLIEKMDRPTGRFLLMDTISNFMGEFSKLGKAVGDAWKDVFGKFDASEGLYNVIEMLHDFSEEFKISKENAQNFKTIMEGIFSGLSITTTIFSKTLISSIKLLDAVLGLFGTDILGAAAYVASLVTKLKDWLYENTFIGNSISKIASVIHAFVKGIYDCIMAFVDFGKSLNVFDTLKEKLSKLFNFEFGDFDVTGLVDTISSFFTTLAEHIRNGDFIEFGKNIIDGLVIGITEGIPKAAKAIMDVAKTIINTFCEMLGIQSPAKVFIGLGGFLIAGLVKGILDGEPYLLNVFKDLIGNVMDIVSGLIQNGIPYAVDLIKNFGRILLDTTKGIGTFDFGSLFIMGSVIGMGILAHKMIKVLDKFATPFETIGKLVGSVNKVFNETGAAIERLSKAQVWKIRSEALLNLAKALAVLTASLIGVAMAAEKYNLWGAVAIIAALSAILVALSWAMNKMDGASVEVNKQGAKLGGFKTGLLTMAASLLILAMVVKIIGGMDIETAKQGFIGLGVLAGIMVGIFAAYGMLVKGKAAQNINKAGRMMLGLSVSLLLMIAAAKLIAGMSWPEMGKAAAGIVAFVGVVALLSTIAMIPGKNIKKLGGMMLSISGSLFLMTIVAKMIAGMEWGDMGKAAVGILGLVGIIALLMTICMIPGKNLDQIGKTLAGIAGAMLMLAITSKILATMSFDDMKKAAYGLAGLSLCVGILIMIVEMASKDAPKMAGTLLAMSVAMAILAGIAIVLSMVDVEGLKKGITAMTFLAAMMAMMIVATRGASDCKGNLIVMTVAIGVMIAAVAGLSMIDPEKLVGAVAAVSTLMGVFGLMVKLAENAKASVVSLAVMTVVVAALAFIVAKLSELPCESVLVSAVALSVLLLSLAVSFKLIATTGPAATAALPALAAMLGAVAILAIILGALTALDCAPSLETALGLSVLLLAMSGVCLILASVGSVAPLALTGALAFDGVILIIGGLLLAIGALMAYVPKAEEFLDKGIEVLEKIGTGLGNALGNFVTGFLGTIIDALPGYGEKLTQFMQNLQGFIDGMSGIGSDFGTGLANLSDGLGEISIFSLGKLVSLAKKVSEYSNEASGIDSGVISRTSKAIKTLASTIKSLSGIDASGAADLKKAVNKLKGISINELTRVFNNASTEFKNVGKNITNSLAEGIIGKQDAITKATKTVVKAGSKAASDLKSSFKSAGKDLGAGLVEGIDAKQNAVYWAGYRLGRKAVEGEKDGQKSHSPSKETIKAGKWLGEGLIVGMENISTKVYRAGRTLGSEAADSMTSVVSRMSDVINSDIDAQPTIRPVLDLSDVKSGTKLLNGMFGNKNVGVVNSMMTRRGQNGVNDDVVSAIDKLNKKLSNIGNTSYSINGINVSGDSDVESAIRVLVRAAKVEGRA